MHIGWCNSIYREINATLLLRAFLAPDGSFSCPAHYLLRQKTPHTSAHEKDNRIPLFFAAITVKTQAVSRPADGGYPGGNTAEEQNAQESRRL